MRACHDRVFVAISFSRWALRPDWDAPFVPQDKLKLAPTTLGPGWQL
jgi:hypothetical protein